MGSGGMSFPQWLSAVCATIGKQYYQSELGSLLEKAKNLLSTRMVDFSRFVKSGVPHEYAHRNSNKIFHDRGQFRYDGVSY